MRRRRSSSSKYCSEGHGGQPVADVLELTLVAQAAHKPHSSARDNSTPLAQGPDLFCGAAPARPPANTPPTRRCPESKVLAGRLQRQPQLLRQTLHGLHAGLGAKSVKSGQGTLQALGWVCLARIAGIAGVARIARIAHMDRMDRMDRRARRARRARMRSNASHQAAQGGVKRRLQFIQQRCCGSRIAGQLQGLGAGRVSAHLGRHRHGQPRRPHTQRTGIPTAKQVGAKVQQGLYFSSAG